MREAVRSSGGVARLRVAAAQLRRPATFLAVGLASTFVYAASALLIEHGTGLGPVPSSLLACCCAMPVSYSGHRRFTFRSKRPHAQALPGFALLTAIGMAVAAVMPWVMTVLLGLPFALSVLATCVAVPLLNYLGLARLIFPAR